MCSDECWFSAVKGAKLSDMETKIVFLCWECLFYLIVKIVVEGFSSFVKQWGSVTLVDMGAGERDEAVNGSVLARLCDRKDDQAHSTVF